MVARRANRRERVGSRIFGEALNQVLGKSVGLRGDGHEEYTSVLNI